MASRNQLAFSLNNRKYSLELNNNGKTLIIKQPNILEMQILYTAIMENKKIVNSLFKCPSKH